MMGFCRDTGGSWSRYYLAHTSQLYRVPKAVSDENALMVEPFACGLHAALLDFPTDDESILILGAGTIGLVTLAALRALGSKAEILVSARYPFQAEAARRLGASRVLIGEDLYAQVAVHSGASLYKPLIGKRVLVGGMPRVYECVGSSETLDDALHLAATGGKVIVVSVPGIAKGVDWTAVFSKELQLGASSVYHHVEPYGGRTWRAFDLALDLMSRGEVDLGWMVTHRYPLAAYKQAFSELGDRRCHAIIKAVFEFGE
jgi:threonine dehydrogenase-like Zn-dependent dehydrogenase